MIPLNTPTDRLFAAECHAERASLPELRLRIRDVQAMRASLDSDDLDYAQVLLIKLQHLVEQQSVALV